GGEVVRGGAGGKEKFAVGVEPESAGHRLGGNPPGLAQLSGRPVDCKPGDAVMAAIADIEKPAGWCPAELRAGMAHSLTGRQRRDLLRRRQGAGSAVEPVGGYAASLLVGEIDAVERRVENIVPRPEAVAGVEPERRILAEPPGLRVKAELRDEIG